MVHQNQYFLIIFFVHSFSTCSFIDLFNSYLLINYYVPGSVLAARISPMVSATELGSHLKSSLVTTNISDSDSKL